VAAGRLHHAPGVGLGGGPIFLQLGAGLGDGLLARGFGNDLIDQTPSLVVQAPLDLWRLDLLTLDVLWFVHG
jgi:hypothetical protein